MQTRLIYGGNQTQRRDYCNDYVKNILNIPNISNTDFILLNKQDGKKNISINQIRLLINKLKLKPVNQKFKIAIIENAQDLSTEAQNALLKVIEEPPEYAQIFLTVDYIENLLPTIKSRCIIVNLSNANDEIDEEVKNLLSFTIGEKIDWLTQNKQNAKDLEWVLKILNNMELIIRHELLTNDDLNNVEKKKYVNFISKIHEFKNDIAITNVNTYLGLERLLVLFDRIR